MQVGLTIIAAMAGALSAPSQDATPAPPAALQGHVHGHNFDPGDYGWLRGLYPGASAADRTNFEAANGLIQSCIAAHQNEVRTELRAIGIANPTLDHVPPSDPLCAGLASSPNPTLFQSFGDLQRADAEARPYADSFVFALRSAQQLGERLGSVAEEMEGHVIPDQMARLSWGHAPWTSAPLSPGAKTILDSRLSAATSEVDHENTEWLKWIVAQHGWPTISKDGGGAAANAWLLVQHADADPAFQLKVLRLMEPLLAKAEVDKGNYAYLYDRVMVNIGQKQRYGTQMMGCQHGKRIPQPIEDEAGLAARRAQMGLPIMADYLKLMDQTFGPCAAG